MTSKTEEVQMTLPLEDKEDKGSPVVCAYVIGVRHDGSFIFNIVGEDQGLVQLLGLHALASKQIDAIIEDHLDKKD